MITFQIGVATDGYASTENTEDGRIEVWVEVFCILASSQRGDVWCLVDSHVSTAESAEEDLKKLDHNPETNPDAWAPCPPIYGSDAWDTDAERELACFEADAYGEARPNW